MVIAISAYQVADLAAYGTVVRFGPHHKELSACYPREFHSESSVLMEGVVAALKMITRPCCVTVVACNGYQIHSDLMTTPFEHLRAELTRLEDIHTITWESRSADQDIAYGFEIAKASVSAYRAAVEVMRPGFDTIRRVMDIFNLGFESRVSVRRWVSKSEEGLDKWGEPVEISVVRD